MPREQINFPGDGRDENGFRERVLHVVWVPEDGGVYVELEADAADFHKVNPEVVSSTGMFSPSLTRDQINRMIRALRRARDKVFGPDA